METKNTLLRPCRLDTDTLQQVRFGSPNLLLEAVRQGLGATVFNESISRVAIAQGGIAEVDLPNRAMMTSIALTPKGPRRPLAMPFATWVQTLL
jgi:DNA-binding transcriptional LysR family regulator